MFQVVVLIALGIIVVALVPEVFAVAGILFAVVMLLGFIRWLWFIFIPLAIWLGWFYGTLDERILEALEQRGGEARVGVVLKDLGLNGTEGRTECSFAVCHAYSFIDGLQADGRISIRAPSGRALSEASSVSDVVKISRES